MKIRVVSLGVIVTFLWATAAVVAQEQAPTPSFKEGDTWQFNISRKGQIGSSTEQLTGIYELAYSQGKVKLYEVSGSQKVEFAHKPGSPSEGLIALVGQSEQRPSLKFPLSVGQKWTYEYKTRTATAKQDQNRSVEVNVAGMEQVVTPAGSYGAYKIVRTESWPRGGRQVGWTTSTTTYFYSPETRSVIKRSTASDTSPGTVELELIKFTPGN